MLRSLFGLALLVTFSAAACAQPPEAMKSPTPKVRLARVTDGKLILEDVWPEERAVPETRTTTENGVTKTYTVLVTVHALRSEREEVALKDVKAFDLDGRQVTPGRMEHMLKERIAVVILHRAGKLDPAYRKILRDDTLVLIVPQQPVLP